MQLNKIRNLKMKITTKKKFGFWIMMAFFTFQIQAQNKAQLVSPLQSGHYMPGFISIRDFADPAPTSGLIFMDYNIYLSGNSFTDKDGNKVKQVMGPEGIPINLDTNVGGYINDPLLMYISKGKLFGATYIGGISVPYNTVNLNLAYSRIGDINAPHDNGNTNSNVAGFSDLNVMPLYLSWGLPQFDITAGYMFYAPTGKYVPGGNDNTGFGYWSNVFQAFTYYYPMKTDGKTSKAMAIMFAPTYEIIGKIKDSEVKPGNRLDFDYGIDQYFTESLSVGIYGGNTFQVGDDTGSGVYWNGAVKDRVGIVGIQSGYLFWQGRLQAVAKYGHTYGSRQHFDVNVFQINLTYITNALTGNKRAKKTNKQ